MLDVRDWCAHHAGAPMTSVLHIGWNGLYFADNIFKLIFVHENCILIQIILKCVPSFPTNNEMMRWYIFLCHLYILKFWTPYLCTLLCMLWYPIFYPVLYVTKFVWCTLKVLSIFHLWKNKSAEPFDINIKHGFYCGKTFDWTNRWWCLTWKSMDQIYILTIEYIVNISCKCLDINGDVLHEKAPHAWIKRKCRVFNILYWLKIGCYFC